MATHDIIRERPDTRLLTRLFSKIKISTERFYKGMPCWEWQGSLVRGGYGRFMVDCVEHPAHRVFYHFFVELTDVKNVCDHLCRNRGCVNPVHVEQVTNHTNILRGHGIAAKNAAKSHCKAGHKLSGDNLTFEKRYGKAYRRCRACDYVRQEKFHNKLKELPYNHPARAKYRNFPSRVKH